MFPRCFQHDKSLKKVYSLFLMLMLGGVLVNAQNIDSVKTEKERKNILKLIISSLLIYDRALLFGYERILKKNQTFSVQVGSVSLNLGSFVPADSITFLSTAKSNGFSITGDYRFYLPKENKDNAPHGIYIGPYVSYVTMSNESNLLISNSNLLLKSDFQVVSIGGQLGYQFLLGKRWTLDLVLVGPAMTNYKASMELVGNIDPNDVDPALQKILESMAGKFPLLQSLLHNDVTTFSGRAQTWAAGFRYSMHIGFRL